MQMTTDEKFMMEAISLSREGMQAGHGGPFGCVIVKNGQIIGRGNNNVVRLNDPTAHAEIVAIRQACEALNSFQLTGCTVYTSCEPCPMCMGALYWARPDKVYYANSRRDAANIGFDDSFIYQELNLDPEFRRLPMHRLEHDEAMKVFEEWQQLDNKVPY